MAKQININIRLELGPDRQSNSNVIRRRLRRGVDAMIANLNGSGMPVEKAQWTADYGYGWRVIKSDELDFADDGEIEESA